MHKRAGEGGEECKKWLLSDKSKWRQKMGAAQCSGPSPLISNGGRLQRWWCNLPLPHNQYGHWHLAWLPVGQPWAQFRWPDVEENKFGDIFCHEVVVPSVNWINSLVACRQNLAEQSNRCRALELIKYMYQSNTQESHKMVIIMGCVASLWKFKWVLQQK